MTHDFLNGAITTEEEFNAALGEVLLAAARNDIDPRGSWVYRNGAAAPDLEVMILELAKRGPTN